MITFCVVALFVLLAMLFLLLVKMLEREMDQNIELRIELDQLRRNIKTSELLLADDETETK